MNIYEKLAKCCSASEVERMLKGTSHAVVPKMPTQEMMFAGSEADATTEIEKAPAFRARIIYLAMLNAQPSGPEPTRKPVSVCPNCHATQDKGTPHDKCPNPPKPDTPATPEPARVTGAEPVKTPSTIGDT
jgi:hypothetical protein